MLGKLGYYLFRGSTGRGLNISSHLRTKLLARLDESQANAILASIEPQNMNVSPGPKRRPGFGYDRLSQGSRWRLLGLKPAAACCSRAMGHEQIRMAARLRESLPQLEERGPLPPVPLRPCAQSNLH